MWTLRADAAPALRQQQHRGALASGGHVVAPGDHAASTRRLRITTADAGQAERNSTDCCTDAGTSSRAIRSNPNFGKNRSAVVVSRYTAATPRPAAMSRAAVVNWWPIFRPRTAAS